MSGGWAAAAQAAGELLGAKINADNVEEVNEKNIGMQKELNERNIELQKEFAKHGIRWKVADAEAAGLHPLAALGAQTTSFSPISVGALYQADSSIGDGFARAGQSIGRALHATATAEERENELAQQKKRQDALDTINFERHKADLQHMELQNAYLASQIKRLEVQNNPPMPSSIGGTKAVGSIVTKPSERISATKNVPSVEAASTPGFKKFHLGGPNSGGTVELPGQGMSEAIDSLGVLAPFYVLQHNLSRHVDRIMSGGDPPSVPVPKGYKWEWSKWKQEWIPVKQ